MLNSLREAAGSIALGTDDPRWAGLQLLNYVRFEDMSPVALSGLLPAVEGVLQLDNPDTTVLVDVDRLSAPRVKMRLDFDMFFKLHACDSPAPAELCQLMTPPEPSTDAPEKPAVPNISRRFFQMLKFGNQQKPHSAR